MRHGDEFEALIAALKVAVATLRERGIPFVLGGSVAAWARGGPEPKNDLDLMLKPEDAEAALAALAEAGMRPEHPPEEWLVKAWHGDVLIDLIFAPSGVQITDELLGRADQISVMALATPVMALEDVLSTKLHALDEHSLDYTNLVAIARSVREQIDWPQLRARTADTPYAGAFFTLVEQLGIAPGVARARPGPSRVRVVPSG
jgi:predicted nucleotidyltransferase